MIAYWLASHLYPLALLLEILRGYEGVARWLVIIWGWLVVNWILEKVFSQYTRDFIVL
jgi:hypothetical protein